MSINVEEVVRGYIDKTIHMSLATVNGDQPWVCEVHFAYDHSLNLYFSSLTSTRHAKEIAANPHVSGNIVKQHELDEYPEGIYFEGHAYLLAPGEEQNTAFGCMKERLGLTHGDLEDAKDPNKYQFFKIKVTKWYAFGKFGQPSGSKYELDWHSGEKGK